LLTGLSGNAKDLADGTADGLDEHSGKLADGLVVQHQSIQEKKTPAAARFAALGF
jgi:hypothetical protein